MNKKFATFGVALALTTVGLGIAAQPAKAAGPEAQITKKLAVNQGDFLPVQKFQFQVTSVKNPGGTLKAGPEGGASIADITFEGGKAETAELKKTQAVTLNTDVLFKGEAGVYVYEVSEVKGDLEGVNYSDQKYRLFVQVDQTAEGKKIGGYWIENADGKGTAGAAKIAEPSFDNTYKNSGDPDKPNPTPDPEDKSYTHTMFITKKIEGNGKSADDEFTFTITAADTSNSASEGKDVYTVVLPDGTTQELKAGASVAVKIKGGQTIKVKGVTKGDQITVTETDTKGYEVSYSGTDSSKDGIDYKNNNVDKESTVTNFKNNTPTGMFVQYAPFAVMVAAAGTLVAVSKKRSDQ